jgi:hypothetical protein
MKPFGKESGRARLCNPAGCSAQRDSEQASKGTMREPTRPLNGEGRCAQEMHPTEP